MIKDYLKKLQQLQLDTINTLVNISICTHYDIKEKYPWLDITVTIEGYHTQAFKVVPIESVYMHEQMYDSMYKTKKENEEHQAAVYAKIEKFVNKELEALNK